MSRCWNLEIRAHYMSVIIPPQKLKLMWWRLNSETQLTYINIPLVHLWYIRCGTILVSHKKYGFQKLRSQLPSSSSEITQHKINSLRIQMKAKIPHILKIRRGTAATRPSVNIVGNVRNLDRCSKSEGGRSFCKSTFFI